MFSVRKKGGNMGSARNHWKRSVSLEEIQAILTQPSYKDDVRGNLPNGEEQYVVIAKMGHQSMKEDKALFWRAHCANGGGFGLPHGSGVWLDEGGNIVRQ